jgi:hypothetical protein
MEADCTIHKCGERQRLQFTATSILRIEGDKLVSENDVSFCNPIYWIAKTDIVFAYRQDSRPAAASGKDNTSKNQKNNSNAN